MANTQAICTSFKVELLKGHHALGTSVVRAGTTKDNINAALYLASATKNASTTSYGGTVGSVADTGEVSGTNYTPGGATSITNATEPTSTSTIAHWTPSASIQYTTVTLSTAFDCVLLYNATQSNKAIAVYTFGSQTITAGTFTLTMPTNDGTTGLLRLN
jgi:hypothetical protein